ncbi:MAG: alpha/beta fold hydrolase [Actinomycetota bacterium]
MAETRFAQNDGVRIAYETRGERGPWLVLVFGVGFARWGWDPIAQPLAEKYRLVLIDNRGIGESDVPTPPYRVREMAADVIAVMDDAGVERAHVVGTSLGGLIAQELAIIYPERVDKLVLVCTTPGGPDSYPMPEASVAAIAAAMTLPPEQGLLRFVENALAPDTVANRRDLVETIWKCRLAKPPNPVGHQGQFSAGAGFDASTRLDRIKAPTLVFHGTVDGVVDPRNSELLAKGIPGAKLEWLEGAGHLMFWEQPERCVEVLCEFLDGSIQG